MTGQTETNQPYGQEKSSESGTRPTQRDQRQGDLRSKVADHLKSRLSERVILSGVKLRKSATALKNTGNCFKEEEQGLIGEYIQSAADRLEQFSVYLQDTPLEQIKEDARDLSLKKPWVFMGACFSTGVLLGRIFKAAQAQR